MPASRCRILPDLSPASGVLRGSAPRGPAAVPASDLTLRAPIAGVAQRERQALQRVAATVVLAPRKGASLEFLLESVVEFAVPSLLAAFGLAVATLARRESGAGSREVARKPKL